MIAPQRSWHGAAYVLSRGAEEFDSTWSLANGSRVVTWAGERGRLIAISEGRNGAGFRICEWCGWGTAAGGRVPGSHPHLLKDGECTGPLAWRSLAHPYETDLLEISFDSIPGLSGMTVGEWRAVLYALLEGASDSLDISRDDMDGTLYPKAGRKISLVLFDTVPGGAGGALRIARSFPLVLETALGRMARCECGEETSCYGCLRNFRNQAFHEQLRRGDALAFLGRLVKLRRTKGLASMTRGGIAEIVGLRDPFAIIVRMEARAVSMSSSDMTPVSFVSWMVARSTTGQGKMFTPRPKLLGGRRRALESGGPLRGVTPGRHAELRQDGGDVVVHGAGQYHHPARDLRVGQPGGDHGGQPGQDLVLPDVQVFQAAGIRLGGAGVAVAAPVGGV